MFIHDKHQNIKTLRLHKNLKMLQILYLTVDENDFSLKKKAVFIGFRPVSNIKIVVIFLNLPKQVSKWMELLKCFDF